MSLFPALFVYVCVCMISSDGKVDERAIFYDFFFHSENVVDIIIHHIEHLKTHEQIINVP